ncbi:MAG TPA: hypothetical protein PK916_12475 [Bacteroidota bacterium]|mgnify:FL=1|nr:hypothetical protein [Bacteroidota bacterium]
MLRHTLLLTLTLLFAALCASPLLAQDAPEDEVGRRRLEDLRRIKLIEALDLSEEQAVRLFAREKDFRERERALMDKRQSVLKSLEDKLPGISDEAVREHVQRLHDVATEMIAMKRDYALSLSDILSMKQIARLVLFEDRFAKEVKRFILRSRKGGQGR